MILALKTFIHGRKQLGDGGGLLHDTGVASTLPNISKNKAKQPQQPQYDIGFDDLHLHGREQLGDGGFRTT